MAEIRSFLLSCVRMDGDGPFALVLGLLLNQRISSNLAPIIPPLLQKYSKIPTPSNDNSFDTSLSHPDPQTSSARSGDCQPPAGYDRTAPGPASADSWRIRPRIFGSMQRWIWQWLGGWRRSGTCGRRLEHGRGYLLRRICPSRG